MRAGETGLNNSGSAGLFHVDSVVSGDSVLNAGETGLNTVPANVGLNTGSAELHRGDSVVSGDSVLNVGETGLYTVPANVGLNTGSAGWIKRFSSAQYLAAFSFLQQKNET